jgi:hypothetical protein
MSSPMAGEYVVDTRRLYARVDERTGVFVQADYRGETINADLCQLTHDSLRRYLARAPRSELEWLVVYLLRL